MGKNQLSMYYYYYLREKIYSMSIAVLGARKRQAGNPPRLAVHTPHSTGRVAVLWPASPPAIMPLKTESPPILSH